MPSDCLFCRIVAGEVPADIVASDDAVLAFRDINPQADTHLLVLPKRHVASMHEVGQFPAEESKRMLEFVAEVAAQAGLTDYRVVVNAGAGAGQTIFHLHWHILGGRTIGRMA